MARILSFIVLVAILLVMGALFFRVMAGFFVPLFLSVLLVVMFRPVHRWIVVRSRGRERLAAGLTTLAILAIVMAPLILVLIQAGFEASLIARHWNSATIKEKLASVRQKTGLSLPPPPVISGLDRVDDALGAASAVDGPDERQVADLSAAVGDLASALYQELSASEELPLWVATSDAEKLAADRQRLAAAAELHEPRDYVSEVNLAAGALRSDLLGSPWKNWLKRQANPSEEQLATWREKAGELADSLAVGGAQYAGNVLPDLLIGLAVMIVSLYYFLADGPAMIKSLMRLSPLDDRYEEQLLDEFTKVSRAVVVATLLSAVVQGVLAGAGYLFAGLGSVALLTMLTMLFALVPFVGGAAVWVPCCLWLLLEGRVTAAILLALYCGIIVSASDNIIKPLVLQGQSNLHPLLALLSVLGGVKALGPIGIVVGPMVVAFLQVLLQMLQIELDQLSGSKTAGPSPAPPA
ncbi:MAG TPA: AI-2E family transporter [Pirellulales bacterium]|nr:AI-2E family transporter [Pirellulales bacterium]